MKILKKYIFVFITIISIPGILYYLDKNNNKVKVEEYYPNGKLKYVGGLNNGLRHGIWKYYHPNGKLWSEGEYNNGTREGKSLVYFENGNLRIKGSYKGGKPYGKWYFYDENGKLIETKDFH
jgi:antitoxin component YwqK of YwqJK toxin-antitoxin module